VVDRARLELASARDERSKSLPCCVTLPAPSVGDIIGSEALPQPVINAVLGHHQLAKNRHSAH
jgi:hypothetical protein